MSDGWEGVHEAQRLAKSRPDQLLAFLPTLRALTDDRKQFTLDQVGTLLALASLDRPTLAEMREAIDCDDTESRSSRVHTEAHIPSDFDEVMLRFVIDALGCANEPLSRPPKPSPPGQGNQAFTASSANQVSSTSWKAETTSCTIKVDWENDFFPGDVNEPVRDSNYVVVEATRRGRPATIRVSAFLGARELTLLVDAPPAERDPILIKFWRTFARRW